MNHTIFISILTLLSALPALEQAEAASRTKKPTAVCVTDYKQNLDPSKPEGAALKAFEDNISHGPMMPSVWKSEGGTHIEVAADDQGKMTMTIRMLTKEAFEHVPPRVPTETMRMKMKEMAFSSLDQFLETLKTAPKVMQISLCLDKEVDGSAVYYLEPVEKKSGDVRAYISSSDKASVSIKFTFPPFNFSETVKRFSGE